MSKPSDLKLQALEPERMAQLRSQAAHWLAKHGNQQRPPFQTADALSVLHTLASSQKTAPDALALLHELQVYQVELELQAQELRESRAELESALRRQVEIHDHLAVGCFVVDHRLALQEVNQTGAAMLGIPRHDIAGLPLDAFFCADSADRFRAALKALAGGLAWPVCPVQLLPREGPARQALASVNTDPSTQGYLVSLTPVSDGETDGTQVH